MQNGGGHGANNPLSVDDLERMLMQQQLRPQQQTSAPAAPRPVLPALPGSSLWSWNPQDTRPQQAFQGFSAAPFSRQLPRLDEAYGQSQERKVDWSAPNLSSFSSSSWGQQPVNQPSPGYQVPYQYQPQTYPPPSMPNPSQPVSSGWDSRIHQNEPISGHMRPGPSRPEDAFPRAQVPFPPSGRHLPIPSQDRQTFEQVEQTHLMHGVSMRSRDSLPYEMPRVPNSLQHDLEIKRSETATKQDQRARFEWVAQGSMEVRPNVTGPDEYIDVTWEIPAANLPYESLLAASGNQRKAGGSSNAGSARDDMQGDWIGLFRTKQRIDDASNFILTRETAGRASYDPKSNLVRGKVRLRAPRGVGSYDFRYFTKTSGDASNDPRRFPVARSPPLTVTVQGNAIIEALHFVEKNLKDKKRFAAAAQQLGTLLRQLSNLRQPVQHGVKPEEQERRLVEEIWRIICFCLERGVQLDESLAMQARLLQEKVNEARQEYEEAAAASGNAKALDADQEEEDENHHLDPEKQLDADGDADNIGSENMEAASGGDSSKRQVWIMLRRDLAQTERDRAALASSVKGVLDDVRGNQYLRSLLMEPRRRHLSSYLRRYSAIEERFLSSEAELNSVMQRELGITRWGAGENGFLEISIERAIELESAIERILPSLIPGQQFYEERRAVIRRLQALLDSSLNSEHGTCKLAPFGSSANSFGSPNSDLDLCLVFSNRQILTSQEAADTVTRIAELLKDHGYLDIDDARKTARIPIVQFKDPMYNIECDICVNNPLAIRNTLLLRTYGSIDERAREAVYVVKAWAKARKLNDPSSHTLSSYGWLLLCINYMQRIGLLPVLQGMPVVIGTATGIQQFIPTVMVPGADGRLHDTYFFGDPESSFFSSPEARERAAIEVRQLSVNSPIRLGQILCGFFWDIAMNDWRRWVGSVRAGDLILKVNKAAEDSWRLHPRCAIEDPFETSYDVGHVLRDSTFHRIRIEAARAYALLSGCYEGHTGKSGEKCLQVLLETYEEEKAEA